jgi:hypothetical protein
LSGGAPGAEPSARWAGRLLAAGLALGAIALAISLRPRPEPDPPASFAFAVLGDAPYDFWEERQFRRVLRQLDEERLAFVLHVGDIFWHPCSDEMYRRRLLDFQALRHAVVYTPGDNEWTDCYETGSGAYRPLERLARLRSVFFPDPRASLGRSPMSLESQAGDPRFPEFVENRRWSVGGVLFATLHLVGSSNAGEAFPGRGPADDQERERRTQAAIAWLESTFAAARGAEAPAVFLAFHGDIGIEEAAGSRRRRPFEPFLAALESEAARSPFPVGVAHGDGHQPTVDRPLMERRNGRRLERLYRVEVPGSPEVGWVRVVVAPASDRPFRFEARRIPRWLFW